MTNAGFAKVGPGPANTGANVSPRLVQNSGGVALLIGLHDPGPMLANAGPSSANSGPTWANPCPRLVNSDPTSANHGPMLVESDPASANFVSNPVNIGRFWSNIGKLWLKPGPTCAYQCR